MKKIYFVLASCLSIAAVAQDDVSATLVNYSASEATSDDPLLLDFTITNEGGTQVTGDTLYWAISVGSDYYSEVDLSAGPGYVTYSVLTADWLNGETVDVVTAGDITMDWLYDAGGLTPNVCAVAFGIGAASFDVAWDATPADNIMCIGYTVTEVAGIEEAYSTIGDVYVAEGFLNIENNMNSDVANVGVQISNLAGQIVQTESLVLVDGMNEIQLSEITSGIYMVAITINGETTTTKVSVR